MSELIEFGEFWVQGFLLGKYGTIQPITYPDITDAGGIYDFWHGFCFGCADVAEYDRRYELATAHSA